MVCYWAVSCQEEVPTELPRTGRPQMTFEMSQSYAKEIVNRKKLNGDDCCKSTKESQLDINLCSANLGDKDTLSVCMPENLVRGQEGQARDHVFNSLSLSLIYIYIFFFFLFFFLFSLLFLSVYVYTYMYML